MNSTIARVATALLIDYTSVYYIDLKTGYYECYSTNLGYQKLELHSSGEDFFADCQRDILAVVYKDDQEMVSSALQRESLLKQLREQDTLSIVYRLLLAGGTSYTRMMVFWANDHKHLIMCVMNIDHEIQEENAIKKTLAENATFYQIATSLANQYDTIYYVNMLNDHYIEFSSTDIYKSLEVRPSGDDFFTESLNNIERVIHPDDREAFHRLLDKPNMIRMLQGKHMVTHTYRLLVESGVMYARLSIIWATDNKHLIIGVMNIDQEVRREQEIRKKLSVANEKAYRDEMTGVKNKTAFTEYMETLQGQLRQGQLREFSIVICDVNGLKEINDSLGHIEGDAYIRNASQLICKTWTHSPVFRIGGDEFAVILQGADYQDRQALLDQIREAVRANQRTGSVVVAVGMADFDPGTDGSADEVFQRADDLMYKEKAILKTES